MDIRLAEPGDLDRVGEITVSAYADFTRGAEDGYVVKLRDAARRSREADLWVAVDGPSVLGSVTTCSPGSPWREIGADDEGEFRMLAVDPGAQGRGVGDALVAHTLSTFRTGGYAGMVLSSLPVMTAAHRLYARHGFTRAPERDWSPAPDVGLHAYALRF